MVSSFAASTVNVRHKNPSWVRVVQKFTTLASMHSKTFQDNVHNLIQTSVKNHPKSAIFTTCLAYTKRNKKYERMVRSNTPSCIKADST